MKKRLLPLVVLGLIPIPDVVSSATLADDAITVEATPLAGTIYELQGTGGNMTALLGPDGVLLVDDDFAPAAPVIVARLKDLGGGSPRYIVNTHFHYDHTGGNEVFGATATIIAATAVRERLMHEQTLWKKQHPAEPHSALPVVTFDQSLALHLDGEDVDVVHLPHGHTDGDSVVFFRTSKVASMGDLYFAGMYPIFHPEHDGSLSGYVSDVGWALSQMSDDYKVVPGHGPVTGKAALAQYYAMIQASMATVRAGIAKGETLQQIQADGLPAVYEPFSHGYVTTSRWIEMVYTDVMKTKAV